LRQERTQGYDGVINRARRRHESVKQRGYLSSAKETPSGGFEMQARRKPERQQALQQAKQAVRAYAHDPSQANADTVEMAWRKVRQLDDLADRREAPAGVVPVVEGGDAVS
jgi:hypothetical protein